MYLEHCHDGIPKRVEATPKLELSVQFSSEYLHPEKGEDEYEEKEEEQKGEDRMDGVYKGADQVTQTSPISAKEKLKISPKAWTCLMCNC